MNDDLRHLLTSAARAAGNVLDLRAAAEFEAGHVRGAASLTVEPDLVRVAPASRSAWLSQHLPSIFLPPRHEPLAVVATDGSLARLVADELTTRGRAPVLAAQFGPGDASRLAPADRGTGVSGRRLWQPPPFLARWSHLLPPPAAGPLLDLACGSGRAAVWLAERGWRVTGIDHQPEALDLAGRLASAHGVSVTLHRRDLRLPESLPDGPWAGILLFRYLDRPLMRRLPQVLDRGSLVVLRTFRDAPGFVGNPQPRHRLARSEAIGLLPGAEVLVHEEGFDPDGRPAAGVVLRWLGNT